MLDAKQLERLSHIEDFVAFLKDIKETRESLIQQLHDRPTDAVQQLAGRILQCDDILASGGWREIENRKRS